MEQKIIDDGNCLIAVFDGYVQDDKVKDKPYWHPERNMTMYTYPQGFKYHTSWDWLMKVVEKIYVLRTVNDILIRPGKTIIEKKDGEIFASPCLPENNSVTECWNAIVQFIQWYNLSKPPTP